MDKLKQLIGGVKPEKKKSTFYADGQLTPGEFVSAGDLLNRQCPTWKWEAGDPRKAQKYLPADKQFLICRGIRCAARVKQPNTISSQTPSSQPGDDFAFTTLEKVEDAESTGKPTTPSEDKPASSTAPVEDEEDDDDEPVDGDAFAQVDEDEDPSAAKPTTSTGCRIYEASIVYDNMYNSPHLYLRGVAENGTTPLTQQQIFEDISDEHARKTVTMAMHPHLNIPFASIHPCKHAATMKMMMDLARDGAKAKRAEEAAKREQTGAPAEKKEAEDDTELIPVEQYFVFFLKFIATICPTMDIDFTVAARL